MNQINFRQATARDLVWMENLHTENMKGYVERIYSWNPVLFRNNFQAQEYKIIKFKTKFIGFIKILFGDSDIYLGEIQLKKEYQNRGIGTKLIESLIEESELSGKKLWLKVVKGNPAENLYQRLGFKVFEESETHKKLTFVKDFSV